MVLSLVQAVLEQQKILVLPVFVTFPALALTVLVICVAAIGGAIILLLTIALACTWWRWLTKEKFGS